MEEASENHADILLLPECFITGYDLPMSYEKSISDDDIRIAKICKYAKKYKIGVVLTSFTKGSKQPQNSAFVINKSGNILMKYDKCGLSLDKIIIGKNCDATLIDSIKKVSNGTDMIFQ